MTGNGQSWMYPWQPAGPFEETGVCLLSGAASHSVKVCWSVSADEGLILQDGAGWHSCLAKSSAGEGHAADLQKRLAS